MPYSWPALRTWTDGENVRHSMFNSDVRDAQGFLYRLHRYKTADQTVSSQSTIADFDISGLTAGDVWAFRYMIIYTNVAGANGITFQVYGGPNTQDGAMGIVGANRATPTALETATTHSDFFGGIN